MTEFVPVAQFREHYLYAPEDGFISFFNSPYYSHTNMTGIDIFPGNLAYSEAFSPVKGTVREIRTFHGHSKLLNASELEYLILIENKDEPTTYTKLLHVKPTVKKGDYIDIGDKIGEFIRSFFFARWTDPHMHAEFRPKEDTMRARGAFQLHLCQRFQKESKYEEVPLKAKLIKYTPNALFLEINEDAFSKQKIAGLRVGIEKKKDDTLITGIMDAGIPYFGHGGIFINDVSEIAPGDIVKVNGISIGQIIEVNPAGKYVRFRPTSFHIRWKEIDFKGISCRLCLKDRFIKIITTPTNSFQHQIGDFDIVKFIL